MNRYTIFCTAEQTKKALELGAPIQIASINEIRLGRYIEVQKNNEIYGIPTAEQMIGWLRSEKNIEFHFDDETNYWAIGDANDDITPLRWYNYSDDKELNAIDAALEYLEKKIKNETGNFRNKQLFRMSF